MKANVLFLRFKAKIRSNWYNKSFCFLKLFLFYIHPNHPHLCKTMHQNSLELSSNQHFRKQKIEFLLNLICSKLWWLSDYSICKRISLFTHLQFCNLVNLSECIRMNFNLVATKSSESRNSNYLIKCLNPICSELRSDRKVAYISDNSISKRICLVFSLLSSVAQFACFLNFGDKLMWLTVD